MHESEQPSRRLVALRISPWSERAKWALDHHRIAYTTLDHAPFVGERRLRRLVGSGKPRATVPVLLAGAEVLTESWDIARYADRHGSGSKLIPAEREAEVRRWNDLADETMAAARALVIAAMLASAEALDEGLPPGVPRALRPLLRPIGRYAMIWFARKYGARLADAQQHQAKLRSTLQTLRAALAASDPYLLGAFSYADIVMATTLQSVSPVDKRYIRLGGATQKAWTQKELAAEFADLITWRDQLYARHRTPGAS